MTKRTTTKKSEPKKKNTFDLDGAKQKHLDEAERNPKVVSYGGKQYRLKPFVTANGPEMDRMRIDANGDFRMLPPDDGDNIDYSVDEWMRESFGILMHEDDVEEFCDLILGKEDDPEDYGDPDMPQEVVLNLLGWLQEQVTGDPS